MKLYSVSSPTFLLVIFSDSFLGSGDFVLLDSFNGNCAYSQMFYAIFQFCAQLKFETMHDNPATDQQKAAWVESDFSVSCASYLATLLTIDNAPFLPMKFHDCECTLGLGGKISYFQMVFKKEIWKVLIYMWSVMLNLYICVIRLSLLCFTILYTIPVSDSGNVSSINRHKTGQSTRRNIQDKSKLVLFYSLPYLKVSWYFL